MFGLGVTELLVILAVVALIGGPSAIGKLLRMAGKVQKAKSKLTPQALASQLLDDEPAASEDRQAKRKQRRSKS